VKSICDSQDDSLEFKPNTSHKEYIYNWVEKFDMLCEPRERQGMIGAFFFLGLMIGLMIIPKLADTYGRKSVFVTTMLG